jgi:[ribosomal protein S18]-alanine N-acetyltransferase
LLAALIAKLKLAGVEALMLEARASNLQAAEFYLRAGFAEIGRRRAYYSAPIEDAVLLELRLR